MKNEKTWIVLGGSTTAPKAFTVAKASHPDATVITTNAGIILTVPEYYYIDDIKACCEFYRQANRIQLRYGTQLVIQRSNEVMLAGGGIKDPDMLIDVKKSDDFLGFNGTGYHQTILSGLYCVQIALLSGAETVLLPGHEGYPLEGDRMVQPGWDVPPRNMRLDQSQFHTKECIAPWFQKVVKLFPRVQFVFYGDLRYEIDGSNVEKVSADEVDERIWEGL